ncbi:MAG: hypothetical protein WBA93_06140 [Microcoleaceae cyanobacterium]
MLQQKDLSEHLQKSYELVSDLAREEYPDLSTAFTAFKKTQKAIVTGELGWCFYPDGMTSKLKSRQVLGSGVLGKRKIRSIFKLNLGNFGEKISIKHD